MTISTGQDIVKTLGLLHGDPSVGRGTTVEEALVNAVLSAVPEPVKAAELIMSALRIAWEQRNGEFMKRLARVLGVLRRRAPDAAAIKCDWVIDFLNMSGPDLVKVIEAAPDTVAALAAIAAGTQEPAKVGWREIVVAARGAAERASEIPPRDAYALRDICFYAAMGSFKADDYSVYTGAAEGMLEAGVEFGAELFTVVREILARKEEQFAMPAVVSCGRLLSANVGLRMPSEFDNVKQRVERVVAKALSKTYGREQGDKLIDFQAKVAITANTASPRDLVRKMAVAAA
ncbi:hypothetical protein [Burkholderia cepacia]|uniref:Uncharacterized protein n=1 Tax=Burkholderia cepacia GG4 TaxID=1009846 RepID=A0A9W3JXC0_BURCE|nr:hypothetical protein [Burkholderia cepacia]AFQ47019.1 hypothetical protein GEM_0568 [Burkholderia cepacia GG4]